MELQDLGAELNGAYPSEVREAFVCGIRKAAKSAADHYRPEIGWNPHLFGTANYHFSCFECEKIADADLPADICRIPKPSPLDFKMNVNGLQTAVHRVGWSADDPIEACFPSSAGGPGRMARENYEQLYLDLPYTHFEQLPRNVVIAYMSNPEDGLCAVYLCVPDGSTDAGRVNHWAYTELVWKKADDLDDMPSAPNFPPPAPDKDPVLSIRPGVIEEQEDVETA
jgi:hypothetical protein